MTDVKTAIDVEYITSNNLDIVQVYINSIRKKKLCIPTYNTIINI